VLCCDEKSQCQALERTATGSALGQGHIATRTHDYYRHGTVTLFAALNYLTGKVLRSERPGIAIKSGLKFLQAIERAAPVGVDVHLILDNYATHKHPRVLPLASPTAALHLHFTPTSASWLNLVERFFRI